MLKKKSINSVFLIIAYVALLIIELFFYVPYEEIQIFISEQNVPHTEIIGSGYATILDISRNDAYVWEREYRASGKKINTQQLLINLTLTTGIFIAIYIIKKKKNGSAEVLNNVLANDLKFLNNRNKQLQNTIDSLHNENEKLNDKIQEYEKTLFETDYAGTEIFPELDIDALAFADTETQERAKRKYAENMYAYAKYVLCHYSGTEKQLNNSTSTECKENPVNQASVFDYIEGKIKKGRTKE